MHKKVLIYKIIIVIESIKLIIHKNMTIKSNYLDRIYFCLCHLGARGAVLCTRPSASQSYFRYLRIIKSFKCPALGICCCSKYPRLRLVHAIKFPTPKRTTLVKLPVIARPPPPLSGSTLISELLCFHFSIVFPCFKKYE